MLTLILLKLIFEILLTFDLVLVVSLLELLSAVYSLKKSHCDSDDDPKISFCLRFLNLITSFTKADEFFTLLTAWIRHLCTGSP